MATIKHPDTFKCDVCGREIERAHSITLPVRWTTEQNEGRLCTPYVKEETIDLCDECFERAVVIEAAGCMGRNSYRLASEEERGAYDEAQNPIREIRKAKTPPCTQCVHSRFNAFNGVTILCDSGAYLDHVERTCCERYDNFVAIDVRGTRWCRFEQKPPKAEDGDES